VKSAASNRVLSAQVSTALDGDTQLRCELSLPVGITVLMGPSGSGKSTTLDLLAGHKIADSGQLSLHETLLFRRQTGQPPSCFVPPQKRRMGYVMQQPMLFPHLSVEQNLAYGIAHLHPTERTKRVQEIAADLQIDTLLKRKPQELSGGQRQRVALGRALVPEPMALLLDEPLSAVDLAQRETLLKRLYEVLRVLHIPVLYVTHSLFERDFFSAPTLEVRPSIEHPSVTEILPRPTS